MYVLKGEGLQPRQLEVNNNNNNNNIIIITNTAHVECKNKSDTSNNRGSWNISESFRKYLSNVPGEHEIK
jgi:hypothetical protein